jgi:hypothetical protein
MVVRKVVAHLCLTLIIKELKFSVDHDRVVTTLKTIKHKISYLVCLRTTPPCTCLARLRPYILCILSAPSHSQTPLIPSPSITIQLI